MKKTMYLAALLLVLIPCLLSAQPYPTRPINILVGFAPGGSVDTATRTLVNRAEKSVGQPFVIANNGGGGGSVALGIVAKERADGYHLAGCTSTGLTLIPQLRAVPYKFDDFVPVMHFATMRSGLVVRTDSPFKSFKDLVDYARANPGGVTYGTAGAGTTVHLALEYIGKQEKIQWTHVPYPGSLPANTALLGGHITAASTDTVWLPFIRDGKFRLLATYEDKRMKAFPDVPTLQELGYDFSNVTWYIVAAPKGTPPLMIQKLEEAFHKAMDDPEFIQAITNQGYELTTYRSPSELRKDLENHQARFNRIITELKITKEAGKK